MHSDVDREDKEVSSGSMGVSGSGQLDIIKLHVGTAIIKNYEKLLNKDKNQFAFYDYLYGFINFLKDVIFRQKNSPLGRLFVGYASISVIGMFVYNFFKSAADAGFWGNFFNLNGLLCIGLYLIHFIIVSVDNDAFEDVGEKVEGYISNPVMKSFGVNWYKPLSLSKDSISDMFYYLNELLLDIKKRNLENNYYSYNLSFTEGKEDKIAYALNLLERDDVEARVAIKIALDNALDLISNEITPGGRYHDLLKDEWMALEIKEEKKTKGKSKISDEELQARRNKRLLELISKQLKS